MTDLQRLTGPTALAALREEPRLQVPSPLDVAQDNYERSLTLAMTNKDEWYEALPDKAGTWHVIHYQYTTYEPDCNYWNWEVRGSGPADSQLAALLTAHNANR